MFYHKYSAHFKLHLFYYSSISFLDEFWRAESKSAHIHWARFEASRSNKRELSITVFNGGAFFILYWLCCTLTQLYENYEKPE